MDARAKRITKLELGTGTFSNVLALWLLHFHTRDVDTVYRILHIYIMLPFPLLLLLSCSNVDYYHS